MLPVSTPISFAENACRLGVLQKDQLHDGKRSRSKQPSLEPEVHSHGEDSW